MSPTTSSNKKIMAVVGILVIVAVIAVGVIASSGKKKTAVTTPTAQSTAPASPSGAAATSAYKDGTYSATSSYENPGGDSALGVSLTLKSGVVTDSTVTPEATNGQSKQYQEMFASGYKSLVVGKQIDAINVSRVSGSSITSQGFNDALSKIKAEAKA